MKLLIIDDEKAIRDVLHASLTDDGFEVTTASDGLSGLEAIQQHSPEIVFLDIWMPGELDGLDVLSRAKEIAPKIQFIVMSGHGTIETAVRAVKNGAWDFIEKPLSMDKISILIKNIISFQNEQREKLALLNKLRSNLALIGETAEMKTLKSLIAQVAQNDDPVLILGEPGSGKTLVAHNIHYLAHRAARNLVEYSCSRGPEELQLAEIFGPLITPVTEVISKSKSELASGGTLLLEEISFLTLESQKKLIEFLNSKPDLKVITTSSTDLYQKVQSGQFLEQLYLMLKSNSLQIPPLREHLDDIPALLTHFGEIFVREGGHELKKFSQGSLVNLSNYRWLGNIRELHNFVERLYILISEPMISVEDLRFAGLIETTDSQEIITFREARADFEKEFILRKISENNGNISRTAEVIGLERSYLHRKIKAYGIDLG